jgi:hypothetical protein
MYSGIRNHNPSYQAAKTYALDRKATEIGEPMGILFFKCLHL